MTAPSRGRTPSSRLTVTKSGARMRSTCGSSRARSELRHAAHRAQALRLSEEIVTRRSDRDSSSVAWLKGRTRRFSRRQMTSSTSSSAPRVPAQLKARLIGDLMTQADVLGHKSHEEHGVTTTKRAPPDQRVLQASKRLPGPGLSLEAGDDPLHLSFLGALG